MTDYVFDEAMLGKANVMLVAEVDVSNFAFEEKDGRFVDSLEFLLVAAHRESGEFFRYDQKVEMKLLPDTRARLARTWYPVARDFELAPGGYQAKIVVRDKNNRRIGTVVHEFVVPDLASFRVSTPVLSDTLQPRAEGQQGPPRAAVIARRSFASDSMLYSQFEVFGAAKDKKSGLPHVRSGFTIRRQDGSVFSQNAATVINPTSLGKVTRLMGTPLAGAPPGDYELVLTFQDEIGGKTIEMKEPFTVVPGPAPAAATGAPAAPPPATAPVAPAVSDAELTAAMRLVGEGDFQAAVERLDPVVRRLSTSGGAPRDLALAHLYLGVAYIGLDQEKAGRANFREALKLDGGLALAPGKFAPNVMRALDEARAEASSSR
jgi:hypothetical protein